MTAPQPVPQAEWSALPFDGATGVEMKVLLPPPPPGIAMLRFAANAAFPEHPAPFAVNVICLEGSGFVRVGDEEHPFRAGEWIHWPANVVHRLWTESDAMTTLMVELGARPPAP